MAVASRKKRISKKLKSSWRKHVNINDVEAYLEDKRLEERLGPPLASVPNDELFRVDIEPSLELLSAKEKRHLKATRPLKCFSALQPYTKVSDPITKRNRVRSKEERKNKLLNKKQLKMHLEGKLKAKEVQAIADREVDVMRRKIKPKRGEFNIDLWDNADDTKSQIQNDQWATTNTKIHNLRGIGIPVKKLRKQIQQKNSPIPAVEPPHPGMSYNPSYEDHQNLLRIVAEKEIKLMKEEDHLTRCTKGMFEKVTEEQRDQSWLVQMSEGLPSKNGTNLEENEASDSEYKTVNPPVQNSKKTRKQRRKQKEQLELEKAKKAITLEKKKVTDIHKLKILKNQIESIEKKQNVLREKRLKRKEQKKKEPKILGSLKYEDPDLEFNMGQEIAGNLKNLKTEGNLLADRFKSMQKRNILAPSKRQVLKKAKVKKYTKPGHKDDDWKKTIAR